MNKEKPFVEWNGAQFGKLIDGAKETLIELLKVFEPIIKLYTECLDHSPGKKFIDGKDVKLIYE